MTGEKELNDLIARIYELGLDAEAWPQMLDEIAGFYGCNKAGYMHIANDDSYRAMHYFRHPEPDAPKVLNGLATYLEMPQGSDVWFELLNQPGFRWEGAYHCNKYVPLNVLLPSDHYNLVVKEVSCFDNLGMRVAENDVYTCCLSIYSDGPDHMFTEEDAAFHAALHSHIRRVVEMQTRFGHAMRLATLQGAALDMLDFAVILANARGKIAFANDAARQMLFERDGIEERAGCIAMTNGESDALKDALARACGVGCAPVGSALAAQRAKPASSYAMEILPFDAGVSEDPFQRFAFDRLAFIVISDPDGKRPASRDRLMIYFGLRPSEARVAELLLAGLSQKEIAEALTLSEGTTRWHVKNLMSKLGVRRESQLVMKLAAALPPVVGA